MKKIIDKKTDRRSFMKASLGACAAAATVISSPGAAAMTERPKDAISSKRRPEAGQLSGTWWI